MIEVTIEQRSPKSIPSWIWTGEPTSQQTIDKFYQGFNRKVTFVGLNPSLDARSVAITYAEVFAGPPWNEYTQCNQTGRYFGTETQPGKKCQGSPCPDCKGRLKLAYPLNQTISYIRADSQRPGYCGMVMREGACLAGFAWGYFYPTVEDFVEEKYKTANMQANLVGKLKALGITSSFFYFSECGLRIPYRDKGLSNILFDEVTAKVRKLEIPTLMRTNYQSPMVAVAQKFRMSQIMGPAVEIERPAGIIRTTGIVVNDTLDSENPERVLFLA